MTCHQPHRWDWQPASCSSCHQEQLKTALHQVKDHTDCATCHQPHAWTVKEAEDSCVKCHNDEQKWLQIEDHRDWGEMEACLDCHDE